MCKHFNYLPVKIFHDIISCSQFYQFWFASRILSSCDFIHQSLLKDFIWFETETHEETPGLKLPRFSGITELKSPTWPSSPVSVMVDGCTSSSKIHRVERKVLFCIIWLWEGWSGQSSLTVWDHGTALQRRAEGCSCVTLCPKNRPYFMITLIPNSIHLWIFAFSNTQSGSYSLSCLV